jgi:hypothetical protein
MKRTRERPNSLAKKKRQWQPMNRTLLLPLQPYNTHEDEFTTQFDFKQEKLIVNIKKPWKKNLWG